MPLRNDGNAPMIPAFSIVGPSPIPIKELTPAKVDMAPDTGSWVVNCLTSLGSDAISISNSTSLGSLSSLPAFSAKYLRSFSSMMLPRTGVM
jgi:hypothetical protein